MCAQGNSSVEEWRTEAKRFATITAESKDLRLRDTLFFLQHVIGNLPWGGFLAILGFLLPGLGIVAMVIGGLKGKERPSPFRDLIPASVSPEGIRFHVRTAMQGDARRWEIANSWAQPLLVDIASQCAGSSAQRCRTIIIESDETPAGVEPFLLSCNGKTHFDVTGRAFIATLSGLRHLTDNIASVEVVDLQKGERVFIVAQITSNSDDVVVPDDPIRLRDVIATEVRKK